MINITLITNNQIFSCKFAKLILCYLGFELHKFRILYANVLKFHKWISHGKKGDPYFFFLFQLISQFRVISF